MAFLIFLSVVEVFSSKKIDTGNKLVNVNSVLRNAYLLSNAVFSYLCWEMRAVCNCVQEHTSNRDGQVSCQRALGIRLIHDWTTWKKNPQEIAHRMQ